jgi:hypothetical protein
MTLGMAAVIGGAAIGPARADDGDWNRGHHEWRGRDWQEREWREREWRWHHPNAYVYQGYPGYTYYAPPPVYYAPPPVYYQPQNSVDFLFHFH